MAWYTALMLGRRQRIGPGPYTCVDLRRGAPAATAMYPSDRGLNVCICIGPVLQKEREKKRRLDNAVAGTFKIQSFFETSTAGGDKKFPREINEIEIAVAPQVGLPAPEDEAAAEPAAA